MAILKLFQICATVENMQTAIENSHELYKLCSGAAGRLDGQN